MLKMADTCQQFGGDLQSIQGQIEDNAKEIDKANSVLYQYQASFNTYFTNLNCAMEISLKYFSVKYVSYGLFVCLCVKIEFMA